MVWAVRSVLLYPSAKCAALRSLRTSNIMCKSSLEYPDAPRVGIGVVTLRRVQQQTEVLLIRRGKEPGKGCLSFPGGSLELGETMQDCAVREILEETGLQLRNNVPPDRQLPARSLDCPRPVDAVDSIHRDALGRVKFHYTIIDLVAVPEDPLAEPAAADDASEVLWKSISELRNLKDLVRHCARIAEEAEQRFDVPEG